MDAIEQASILFGKKSNGYLDKTKSATNSTNVTMISGVAMSDSADGSVTVNLDGYTISDKDEQAVEIPTTVSVKEGDLVQISMVGADGTAKSMLVTGVIAGGDRMQADIETAKDTAATADAAATIAKENAEKANELANSAITNANAANEQAQNAMNSVNTANGKISALQKNVDTMNGDISSAQTAISKNASDISGINQKLSTDYATKGEVSDVKVAVESDIDTRANAITASVAEIYAAKSDVSKIEGELSNRISVNEKGISSTSDSVTKLQSETKSISDDVNAAQSAADAAQKTADAATADANAAQTAADNAKKAADTAQSTANGASTAAANAKSAADSANTAASNAQTAANSAKTAADNAKTAADKANSDLAKLTNTVTTQGTKIDQNSGAITSVANRTTTVENKFTNYYTKTETNSQIKQTADGINSTVSKKVGKDEVISSINQSAEEVKINASRVTVDGTLSVTDAISNAQTAADNAKSAVDNIQVGGRNLIINSEKTIESKLDGEVAVYTPRILSSTGTVLYAGISNSATSLKKGDYVTISVQVDIENVVRFQRAGAEIGIGHGDHNQYIGAWAQSSNLTAKNGVYSFHGRIKRSTTLDGDVTNLNQFIQNGMYIQNSTIKFADGGYIRVSNPKLEIGNKPTDWTPAPEDVQNGIDTAQSTADTAKNSAAAAQSTANSAQTAASDASKAAQNANSAASAAANVAQSASQTANTTKTYFYNDSSGSHVRNQNSTSAGTRADIKADGLHVIDQDDGKELASFTSGGASIGKDSETHSRYSSDGVHFYEGGKSYPFSQIKPVTYKNEKYSAAVLTTAPDDISTDDGLYHSGATVDITAINGTTTDNTGTGRVVLTATTVKSADPKEAYIDVFASNNNPNKASGGKTVEDTYINLVADGIYANSFKIPRIVNGTKTLNFGSTGQSYQYLFTESEVCSLLNVDSGTFDASKCTVIAENYEMNVSWAIVLGTEYNGASHWWSVLLNKSAKGSHTLSYCIIYTG